MWQSQALQGLNHQNAKTTKMTVKVNIHKDDASTNKQFVRTLYERASDELNRLGYDNNLIGILTKFDGQGDVKDNSGINLELSDELNDQINTGMLFPFSLEKYLDGHFGKSRGSSNVTTLKEKMGLSIEETLQILDSQGQLEDALQVIELLREETDPAAETILAYALATYSKGWLAEEILLNTDRFSQVSVSLDKGGKDLLEIVEDADNEHVQVKSITALGRNGKSKFLNKDTKHIFYQWDQQGNLRFAETRKALDMNKRVAAETGVGATIIYKTYGDAPNGQNFRYLWW